MSPDSILIYAPQAFLGLSAFLILILLVRTGITFLQGRSNPERAEMARRRLLNALFVMLGVIVMVIVFNLVTFFLKGGEVFTPQEAGKEVPASPAVNFPPPPISIKIGDLYFNGPVSFSKNSAISQATIYTILCKAEEDYDIIFIGEATKENLLKNKHYACWLDNCGKNAKNLYIAFFWTPIGKYSIGQRTEIVKNLEGQTMPFCAEETK